MQSPFFELKKISKYFSKVIANKNVSLEIRRGEVLALLGENGAGKSTIMKILYGLYNADEGYIYKDGNKVDISSPKVAMELGISMIQQHFSLVEAHTVLENIILPKARGVINYKKCEYELSKLANSYNLAVPLHAKCRDLDVGTRQKVEILKALYVKSELLIMDEPTAVLTPKEADHLMEFAREYADHGYAVVLITHKMKEVAKVADRIIVMRDGIVSGEIKDSNMDEKEISRLMIGRDLESIESGDDYSGRTEEVCMELSQVTALNPEGNISLDSISFTLYRGEIFGIAGVSGNGSEELCEAIMGLIKLKHGSIKLNSMEISQKSIRERVALGIGYVPLDRHKHAMLAGMSIEENVYLKSRYSGTAIKKGFINRRNLADLSDELIEDFNIKTPSRLLKIGALSGGNQQKAILAREIYRTKDVLILNQPTRGLDIGDINYIHSVIVEEKKKGRGILLISTELSEIFALADRIAIIYRGRFMGIYNKHDLDTQKIGLLMAGISPEDV